MVSWENFNLLFWENTLLVTIYKSFIRPQFDYGDVVYDWASNEVFHQILQSLQYSAAIAITGAIRGTSYEKLFQELGLETLNSRCWLRKLSLFYKLIKKNHLLRKKKPYSTRSAQKSQIPFFKAKTNFFKNYFFPAVIMEWNKIDVNICNSASCNVLRELF